MYACVELPPEDAVELGRLLKRLLSLIENGGENS